MAVVLTAGQFIVSCLAIGLGLFLAAGAAREFFRSRLSSAAGARVAAVLGGALLLALGAYGARLTVPL